MPDPNTTNPAAEADMILKAKTPPPLPSGSILGGAAPHAAPEKIPGGDAANPSAAQASRTLVTNPAAVTAALASIEAAVTSIKTAGNVTGDLSLALSGCATATKWLNAALASAAAAAKTTNPPAMPVIPPAPAAKA
jgi:hypothetical protein